MPIQALYRELATDPARSDLILADVIRAIAEGRSPILLTERKDHLAFFAERLRGFVKHLIVLEGGKTEKARRASGAALAAIPEAEERLVLATGRYIGEGLDDARLDTLFLALPISWPVLGDAATLVTLCWSDPSGFMNPYASSRRGGRFDGRTLQRGPRPAD